MSAVKKFSIIIALLLLIVQTSKGQEVSPYKLLLKGEKSPYDSAVAIEINTYRQETSKLQTADQLIESLQEKIELQNTQIAKQLEIAKSDQRSLSLLQAEVNRKEQLNNQLITQVRTEIRQITDKKWYEKLETWVLVGVAATILVNVTGG